MTDVEYSFYQSHPNSYDKNGYNPVWNLYKSRYYAKKQAREDEVIVKVESGYKLMKFTTWLISREQR